MSCCCAFGAVLVCVQPAQLVRSPLVGAMCQQFPFFYSILACHGPVPPEPRVHRPPTCSDRVPFLTSLIIVFAPDGWILHSAVVCRMVSHHIHGIQSQSLLSMCSPKRRCSAVNLCATRLSLVLSACHLFRAVVRRDFDGANVPSSRPAADRRNGTEHTTDPAVVPWPASATAHCRFACRAVALPRV